MIKSTEIGIDLGSNEIKIVHLEEVNSVSSSDLNHLREYESYPVSSPIYSKEYFATLKNAIKDFSKKIKKSKLSLNFVIPYDNNANILFLNLPMVDEKDLNLGIKFEVEQNLPELKNLDYKSAWKITEEYEELKESEILFATLNSEIIKSFTKFKTINWKVNKIMLQPIILERFAKENDVIIDFGNSSSRLYMYKDGNLAEIQQFEVGYSTLISSVKAALKQYAVNTAENIYLDDEAKENIAERIFEAEDNLDEFIYKLYVKNGFLNDDDVFLNDISEKIEPMLLDLIEDVKRNIRTFELKNGINIDNIYYMGGLFNIKYLDNKLEAELDANVEPLNMVAKDIEDIKYDLAGLVAISQKTKDKMDFSQHIKANIDYNSILVGAVTVSLSVSLLIGFLHNNYDELIEGQQETEAKQVQTISLVDSQISQVQNSINDNRMFIDKISRISNDGSWLSDALFILPDAIPLSVSITNLQVVNGQVQIKGYSADYSAIGFFTKKLEEYGAVKIVSIADYNPGESTTLYSVVTDTPETISEKYIMTKEFSLTLSHNGELITR